MAKVREIYGLEADSEFRLAEYPSLAGLTDYVMGRASQGGPVAKETAEVMERVETPTVAPAVQAGGMTLDRETVYHTLVRIVCEKSGYAADEIEADFELEADLGIDTVKQAEIMAAAREQYSLEPDTEFRLSEYESLGKLTDYIVERAGGSHLAASSTEKPVAQKTADVATEEAAPVQTSELAVSVDSNAIYEQIVAILCDQTGYDPSEIEAEFEMEADLGIDTVKQAEIMAKVREVYSLERDEEFRLSEYPTLARLTEYVVERTAGSTEAKVDAQSTPVVETKASVPPAACLLYTSDAADE